MTQAIPVWVVPANELKRNGGSIEIQGGSAYPVVGLNGDSGGGSFQFESGTDSPPVTAPTDSNLPAQYYNTSTGFYYNWNIGTQTWIPVPKVYRALLTQSGENDPVATVLENTLGGTVIWTRIDYGRYEGFLENAFQSGKVVYTFSAQVYGNTHAWGDVNSPSTLKIFTRDESFIEQDGRLLNTPYQALVYP